jgi:hypothetical protein
MVIIHDLMKAIYCIEKLKSKLFKFLKYYLLFLKMLNIFLKKNFMRWDATKLGEVDKRDPLVAGL